MKLIFISAMLFFVLSLVPFASSSNQSSSSFSKKKCKVNPAHLTAKNCQLLKVDFSKNHYLPKWGSRDCKERSRLQRRKNGGDSHLNSQGRKLKRNYWRFLKVKESDEDNYQYGQRCELGRNSYKYGDKISRDKNDYGQTDTTFALYKEGERRITFASYKLLPRTPRKDGYQGLMQMKQTQPSDNGGYSPMIFLELNGKRLRLLLQDNPGPGQNADGVEKWSAPAVYNKWIRVALDVRYSQYKNKGKTRLYFDLNNDGDALDQNERSGLIKGATLKRETSGDDSDIKEGKSIPSHLRVGLYQDSSHNCAKFKGNFCTVGIDNVEVLKP